MMLWNLLLLVVVVFVGYAVYAWYKRPTGGETMSAPAKVGSAIVAAIVAGAAWLYAFLAGYAPPPVP